MANLFNQNPIILDTVWTAGSIPAALTALTMPLDAKKIVWYRPAATTDTLVITDINGNVILQAQCETANVSQTLWSQEQHPLKLKMGAWVLSTLGSGKVIIWK